MQLALHCDDDGERFLSESKMLLYARTPEINADPTSPCILHENLPVSLRGAGKPAQTAS